MALSDDLAAAENSYRTIVMQLVEQADNLDPLAQVAEHLANMTVTLRLATLAAMQRVDLFDSTSAAGRAAEHAVNPDALTPATDRTEGPRDDLGEAGIHLDHFAHLMEAGETMAGHATSHLTNAARPG